MSNGYIYIASNNVGGLHNINYVNEAIYSAKSLRKVDPNANITLFTNKKVDTNIFNNIIIVNTSLRCKQNFFEKSPYKKTIYIDSDTYINNSVNDIFKLLDKYEILCSHDYGRKRNLPIPEYMKIPYGFSELNGGVIAFKKCENFTKMIKLWNSYFHKYNKIMPWDQPSFRIAVWESDIKLYVLPIEYNRRGKHTKEKCINLRKKGDIRFNKEHLKTRIFHFHHLEKMDERVRERYAQDF